MTWEPAPHRHHHGSHRPRDSPGSGQMCLLIKFYCFIVKLDISIIYSYLWQYENRPFPGRSLEHCKEQQQFLQLVVKFISHYLKIYLFRGGWKIIMSWTCSEVFQSHLWLNRHAHSTRIIRVERKFILEIVQIPLINS